MNTTDKGLPERLREMAASDMVPMEDAMRLMLEAADALSAASGKAVAWPERMVNLPCPNGGTDRIIGFRIQEGDPILGDYGLSEPLAWLRSVTVDRYHAVPATVAGGLLGARQAAIRHFMRAALESFVRKQPAASAALERV